MVLFLVIVFIINHNFKFNAIFNPENHLASICFLIIRISSRIAFKNPFS